MARQKRSDWDAEPAGPQEQREQEPIATPEPTPPVVAPAPPAKPGPVVFVRADGKRIEWRADMYPSQDWFLSTGWTKED